MEFIVERYLCMAEPLKFSTVDLQSTPLHFLELSVYLPTELDTSQTCKILPERKEIKYVFMRLYFSKIIADKVGY